MKDPRRLIDDGASPFERDLLSSWKTEQPSARARLAVLGLAATTAGVGVAAGAQAATAKAALAVGTWTMGKSIVVGTLAGVLTVATFSVAEAVHTGSKNVQTPAWVAPVAAPPSRSDPAKPAPALLSSAASIALPIEVAAPPAPPMLAPRPSVPVAAKPKRPVPLAEVAAPVAEAPPPDLPPVVPPRSSLLEEIATLDRARAALTSGDAAKALAGVDAYAAAVGFGALAQESVLLRIQALVKLGRRVEATKVGNAFIAAHPTSAHVTKIREIINP